MIEEQTERLWALRTFVDSSGEVASAIDVALKALEDGKVTKTEKTKVAKLVKRLGPGSVGGRMIAQALGLPAAAL